MSRPSVARVLSLAAALACSASAGAAQFFGPTAYLSRDDSPFAALGANLTVETFEDGLLNQLGVTATAGTGVLAPNQLNDSVDFDDGLLDGNGTAGHSYYSGNANSRIDFFFDKTLRGALPSHVGIVWTDVGNVTTGQLGFGTVTFEAYDALGTLIGSIGPSTVGNGTAFGSGISGVDGTAEDRFFGVIHLPGVARISLVMGNSVDWEVDHLQFNAAPVPLPATAWLLAPALAAVAQRRRPQ